MGWVGCRRTVTQVTAGTASLSSSNCLPMNAALGPETPVIFPPGRARVLTNPARSGSVRVTMTMGIVAVACWAARAAGAPAARAAQQATTTVPIVIITLTDPIGAGFVSSLAQPGGNITGVSGPSAAFIGKQLELLKDAVLGINRVAVLLHPTHPMASPIVSEIARAAQALGIQLRLLEVHGPSELDPVLAAMTRTGAEALLVPPFPLFDGQRHQILAVAAQRRLPVMATDVRQWVEEGALLFYGISTTANYRRAAAYVDKILQGAKPGDLPVEQPMQFELVINLKTAEALGLTIPPRLLFQADEVIR